MADDKRKGEKLPEWADDWIPGRCGCGERLVRPACYCGGHVACAVSGTDMERCSPVKAGRRG